MSRCCRRHAADVSSAVGVCASCLRERLLAIIVAQAKAHKQSQLEQPSDHLDFPRSVSPYVARRKSDTSAAWQLPDGRLREESVHSRWFFSTPQVGPAGSAALEAGEKRRSRKAKLSSLFSGFFRSKKAEPRSSEAGSWLSSVFATRRMKKKKKGETSSVEESGGSTAACGPARLSNRGLSPARCASDDEDGGNSSGESSEPSSWRHRRSNTPAHSSATRRRAAAAASTCRNGPSGLVFCLSPLVRASPSHRNWSQELTVGGDARSPHLPNAASFCKSGSRKLADFGRYNSYGGKCNR